MNVQEKLRLAQQLDRLGVDVIEAGFPIASDGDFQAVQKDRRIGAAPPSSPAWLRACTGGRRTAHGKALQGAGAPAHPRFFWRPPIFI